MNAQSRYSPRNLNNLFSCQIAPRFFRSPSMKNVREANRGLNTIYNISLSENIYRYIDMNNSSSRYIYIVILTFILLSRYLHRYIYFVYLYLYICNSYNDIVISIYWYGYFDIWHRDLDIIISLSRYLFCLSGKIYLRQVLYTIMASRNEEVEPNMSMVLYRFLTY